MLSSEKTFLVMVRKLHASTLLTVEQFCTGLAERNLVKKITPAASVSSCALIG
ncbi:Centromere protein F [Frankliniella fusca]|uniref:Centromere protein F n=1 Tax=Frankliniella fusca TaxID=407009 RepID=A0AAE1GVP3_9NEOP|nr:Centromere protein F [Frankliniella fusca]